MQSNYSYWSCHNFVDKSEEENEDSIYFYAGENTQRLAIADGAGGVGIYCKNWANKLVESIPVCYDNVNRDWYLAVSKVFYEQTIQNLSDNDQFVREKFINQGSYSTLLYVWIEELEKKIFCRGVGDTYLFLFRKIDNCYTPEFVFPNNTKSNIDSSPTLLNWALNIKDDTISFEEYYIQESDIIIACTDSIARWLFMHIYLFHPTSKYFDENPMSIELEKFKGNSSYNSLSKILERIKEINNKDTLIDFLKEEIDNDLLEPDDFTLFIYTV